MGFDRLVDDYDRSVSHVPPASCHTSVSAPPPPSEEEGWLCAAVASTAVWDSVYYLRIAECGYEYEQTHAFFPLLPWLMRVLAKAMRASLVLGSSDRCLLALNGLVISNGAFVLSAVCLYECAPTSPWRCPHGGWSTSHLPLADSAGSCARQAECFHPARQAARVDRHHALLHQPGLRLPLCHVRSC